MSSADIGRLGAQSGTMETLRFVVRRPRLIFRRGHCQKRPRHAMAQLSEHTWLFDGQWL